MFVDVTGRRRAVVRHLVILLGLLLAAYVGVVGVGLLVGADAPLAPWPGAAQHPPGTGDVHPGRRSSRDTSPPRSSAATGEPATTRPAPTRAPASPAPSATAQPTPAVSHPGNSHATPPANGLTKSPPGRRP